MALFDRLPLVTLCPAKSKADGTGAKFTFYRVGRADAVTIPFTLGGTAVAGVDYRPPDAGSVTIPSGQAKAVVKVRLLADSGRTLTLSVTPQPGMYNVAAPGTADFTW